MKSLASISVGFIRVYRALISPYMGAPCRFYPSCSEYAETAIKEHGFLRGFLQSVLRILKCNPLHHGGFDPVKR